MSRCDVLTLDRSTRGQISDLFDVVLVEEKLEVLTGNDSIQDLLEEDKYSELERVYTLLQRKGHGELVGP